MALAMNLLYSIFFVVIVLHISPSENHPTFQHKGHTQPPSPSPDPSLAKPSYGFTQGSLQPEDCEPRCAYRCSNTQYKKPCLFFCNKCCTKCLCVPAGTYGNKQSCPCYNNWKTKRGGPKCP